MADLVTRFAPSPTGLLHLGHAYAALFAHECAREAGGRFLLRIEDIDLARAREEFVTAIFEDLAWLGLAWAGGVRRQSEHIEEYRAALARLAELDVLYPCFCTRRDIAEAAAAPQGDPILYPGTCRGLAKILAEDRMARGDPYALRLDTAKAMAMTGPLFFFDRDRGRLPARPDLDGDPVLARRDAPAGYHLCVTLDDHRQGVTLVTRGEDLLPATGIHRHLQALLDLSVPDYAHHRLILGDDGRRLAKREGAIALREWRAQGRTPDDIRRKIGFPSGRAASDRL